MIGQPSLKQQNAWLIRTALVIHAIAFAYVAFAAFLLAQLGAPATYERLQHVLAPTSLSLGIIAIARLVLLGLVPPGWRDRLIHWRWRYPLPGARAFFRIGPGDTRVDMRSLERAHGPLPNDPGEQGRLLLLGLQGSGKQRRRSRRPPLLASRSTSGRPDAIHEFKNVSHACSAASVGRGRYGDRAHCLPNSASG